MAKLNSQVPEYIVKLQNKGVNLFLNDGKIGYKAPKGTLNAEDVEFIKTNKQAFIEYLLKENLSMKDFLKKSTGEDVFEKFQLTDIQSSYLMGRSNVFDYGGLSCQIYIELKYDSLDPQKVEDIWNILIQRHDMLRASITNDNLQRVLKEVPRFTVKTNDLRNLEVLEKDKKLTAIRDEFSHKVFDIENNFAFDIQVTKLDNYDLLNFSIEFIVADWASIWLLLAEFENLYFNPNYTLKPLDLTFHDYQLAYSNYQDSIAYIRDKEYWCNRLENIPLAPTLPTLPQNNDAPVGFTRYNLSISAEKYSKFKEKTKQYGITPTCAIITAYASVLERWSKNKDFCINLTVLNRLPVHEQIMDIVGDFTSINLLEVKMAEQKTFLEYALQVGNQLFSDMEHRLFSGVEVIRELAKIKGNKKSLMPIVFTSAIGLNSTSIKGVMTEGCISQTPQVFIDCQAMDGDFGLRVNWDIRNNVFPSGLVQDMFQLFENLLNDLAVQDDVWNSRNYISLPKQQEILLNDVNNTNKELPKHLLHSKIIEQFDINKNKVAIIQDDIKYTYEDLILYASSVVSKLHDLNVKSGEYIGVVMPKSVYQIYSVLGILSEECVYVPIDSQQATDRKNTIISNANIRVVLTLSTIEKDYNENVISINVDTLEKSTKNQLKSTGSLDNPAYVIHTSGSTGIPKGVVITHGAAVNTIEDINQRFNVTSNDTAIGLSQLYFDLSVYDIFGLLSVGGTVVYPSLDKYTNPSHWFELVQKYNVTVWNSVPAFMKIFINYVDSNENKLPNLRLVMLSGDWIPLNLFDDIKKYNQDIKCISLGGATEASIWSILYEYNGLNPEWVSIPYGKPMYNQGFRVLDDTLKDCPVLVEGELFITGIGLAKEYLNNPTETNNRFIKNPYDNQLMYRTGDMGRYMSDGNIEFLGRKDFQVKVMGYRIELGEVESGLQKHSSVENVVVVALGKKIEEKKLYAYVKLNSSNDIDKNIIEEDIKSYCSKYLPKYMLPQRIFFTDNIPLTSNGKINRKLVAELVQNELDNSSNEVKNDTETFDKIETIIVDVWKEALNINSISKTDDFYDLGADSLIMGNVASTLKNKFDDKVSFDDILVQMLNYPNVGDLSEFIRSVLND